MRDRRQRAGPEDPLFVNLAGEPYDRKHLEARFVMDLRKLGVYRPTHEKDGIRYGSTRLHSLRHTCAVHLLQVGVDINVIKAWLGHQDVSTTSIYCDLDLDKKRDALEKFLKLDIERMVGGVPNATAPLPAGIIEWLERL